MNAAVITARAGSKSIPDKNVHRVAARLAAAGWPLAGIDSDVWD